MGHIHFMTADPEAHRRFWTMLGAKPGKAVGPNEAYTVQNALILVRKQDQLARLGESGVATREMKLHKSKQPEDLGFVRQQSRQERGQPGCILSEIALECGAAAR